MRAHELAEGMWWTMMALAAHRVLGAMGSFGESIVLAAGAQSGWTSTLGLFSSPVSAAGMLGASAISLATVTAQSLVFVVVATRGRPMRLAPRIVWTAVALLSNAASILSPMGMMLGIGLADTGTSVGEQREITDLFLESSMMMSAFDSMLRPIPFLVALLTAVWLLRDAGPSVDELDAPSA